ncbi:MAG TPA: hypothetical protein DD638_03565, partial [Pasteurellaceae bacterium]|nr:hypothetical protein [Pasteurellaceae bacterium]
LLNQQGEMLSAGTLSLNGTALAIQNHAGTIASIGNLIVDAARLSDTGKLQTKNDASISLKQDMTLNGGIDVEGNLWLKANNVENNGDLIVGKGLNIQTASLRNNENAVISSNVTSIESSSLTNYGLIDGIKTTIKTGILDNIGTGRIYGDQLSIQANTLNNLEQNDKSATIAARKRLDLGVDTLTNRNDSSLISLGAIHIGGILDSEGYATGKANAIYNSNGLIEAQGDIAISSGLLSNTNEYFKTNLKLISQMGVVEYQGSGDPTRYKEGTSGLYVYNDESDHLHTPDGRNHEVWYKYTYTTSIQRTEVLPGEYEAGRIYSNANIIVKGDKIDNVNSRIIAGGKLDVQADIINNQEDKGIEITTNSGGLHNYWRHHKKGRDNTGYRYSDYNPAPEIKDGIGLGVAAYKEYSLPTLSTSSITNINVPQTVDIDVKNMAQGEKVLNTVSAGIDINVAQNNTNLSDFTQTDINVAQDNSVVRVKTQDITLPRSSLFIINPQSTSNYLVETDPAFTQYRQWLSSEYMLNALHLNADAMHKRIGDGFYEQRLVQEQIAELTGHIYLSNYSSQEDQFKALMNNGLTFAKQFQLTPGVALTNEQISRLTSDVIWLVNKEVTLADGSTQTVLYPQVYAVTRVSDINGFNTLLSGGVTNIQALSANNSGTIAGKDLLTFSAEDIINRFGRISAENNFVSARNDIVNIGGVIDAANMLAIQAGRDIIANTTTTLTENKSGIAETLNAQGGFYLTGKDGRQIWVSAGRDIHLDASIIDNYAENALTAIQAGRDILLGTERKAHRYENIHDAENYLKTADYEDIGSQIQNYGKGAMIINAKRDIDAKVATISAVGDVSLVAGNNITLSTGERHDFVDSAVKSSSSSFMKKQTVKTRNTTDQTLTKGTQIDGSNVLITATGDINVIGSDVVAENDLTLIGDNVAIKEATNRVYNENFRQVKKSGVLSSGGFGFSIGNRKETTETDQTKYYVQDSQIGSLKGDTTIVANNHYLQQGSTVTSVNGDVTIQGKQVDIKAEDDRYESNYKHTFEQKGLTIAFTAPVLSAIQAVQGTVEAIKQVGESKDNRINAMAAANAGWSAYRSAQSVSQLTGIGQSAAAQG